METTVCRQKNEKEEFIPGCGDSFLKGGTGAGIHEFLAMCIHVYSPPESIDQYRELRFWQLVSPEDLGVDIRFSNKITGFKSYLYRNVKTGDVVYCFCGTLNFMDWCHNIVNYFGFPSAQLSQALGNVREMIRVFRERNCSLQLTGHSLGGAIASYVGTVLGIDTVTFCPSGIHRKRLKKWGKTVEDGKASVTACFFEGEILYRIQEEGRWFSRFMPRALGKKVIIPCDSSLDPVHLHYDFNLLSESLVSWCPPGSIR